MSRVVISMTSLFLTVSTFPAMAETITVRAGDSLYGLSETHLGDTAYWRDLCEANRNILTNCDQITPGMVLTLPTGSGAPLSQTTITETPAEVATIVAEPSRNLAVGSYDVGSDEIWSETTSSGGLDIVRTAFGQSDGGPLIEYRVSGTATGSSAHAFYETPASRQAVTTGDMLTASVEIEILDGELPEGSNIELRVIEYANDRYFRLSGARYDQNGPRSQFLEVTREMQSPDANAANVMLALVGLEEGMQVDFTVRISALQFERGDTSTSYVAP